MIFSHRYINTDGHWLLGTIWQFRGCKVEMHDTGFSCDCKKKQREKCRHIKSVEMGIFGVSLKEYAL